MTTVRINGKDLPWPEGCPAFNIDQYGKRWFQYGQFTIRIRGGENDFTAWSQDVAIFAAVAARHWSNEWEKAYQRRVKISSVLKESSDKDADYIAAAHRMNFCEEAESKWEELCNQL